MNFIKTLFITSLMMTSVYANELQSYMKDGVIKVTLKDGKVYTFSLNDYMVVPRGIGKKKLEAEEKQAVLKDEKENKDYGDNRLNLYGGSGPKGLKRNNVGNTTDVETDRSFVWGVGYSRRIKGPLNLGIEAISNHTYMGTVGVDF